MKRLIGTDSASNIFRLDDKALRGCKPYPSIWLKAEALPKLSQGGTRLWECPLVTVQSCIADFAPQGVKSFSDDRKKCPYSLHYYHQCVTCSVWLKPFASDRNFLHDEITSKLFPGIAHLSGVICQRKHQLPSQHCHQKTTFFHSLASKELVWLYSTFSFGCLWKRLHSLASVIQFST